MTPPTTKRPPVATIHARNVPDRTDRDWVTGPELVAEADITYRQADYWTRTGLLTPIDEPTPGSGHLRRYPDDQVDRARALATLLEAGVSLTTCRAVIDEVLATGSATHQHVTFHLDRRWALTTSTGAASA